MGCKVSIIVPVYNVEEYLEECLDSIVNQTYENIEIILVNDGSTDDSGKICDKYAIDNDNVMVVHKDNGGLSDARNAGLKMATGEYVYFCDSDDLISKTAIEEMLIAMEKDELDAAFFDGKSFSNDSIKCNENSYKHKKKYKVDSGFLLGFKQLIFDEYVPCIPLHFYKRSFLNDHNLVFREGIIGEDELFSFHVYLNASKMNHIDEELYFRRLRQGSIMTSSGKEKIRFESYCVILSEMEQVLKDVEFDKIKYCKEYMDRIAKSILLIYKKLDINERIMVSDQYSEVIKIIKNNNSFGDPSLILRIKIWKLGVLVSGVRKYIRMMLYGRY